MEKKSKLAEKPTRVPDIEAAAKELAVQTYHNDVERANSESAKSQRFTLLLNTLFGVQPGFIEDYVQGIETYLKMKGKDRFIRGSADQLSGNLIIEFEKELVSKAKLDEAEGQLKTYTACSWSQERPDARTRFVCLATDGKRFRAYSPVATGDVTQPVQPEEIKLALLENIDATKLKWDEFYQFLDRYLLRKEVLHPTSERIVKDFGPDSHAFQVCDAALSRQWNQLRKRSDYGVLYDAWDKYLRIVYGSSLADEELFVRHTYLAMLAKLMVWSRLDPTPDPSEGDMIAILEGTYFKERLGIENFLEEDFFSWVARQEARKATIQVVRSLLGLLHNYRLRELSEDVLKSLYEGLVDPVTRHDLGEYYTPDWLAHRIVRNVLEPNPKASVLDPACGSGTFLYMAIREKRGQLGNSAATLKHILSCVVGMDIHPLACTIAKANYVLGLGELMTKRKQKISIPVYLANSIQPPELEAARQLWHKVECYRTQIDEHEVHIPANFINDPEKCDKSVEAARDFAACSRGTSTDRDAFHNFLRMHHPDLAAEPDAMDVLYSVAETLKGTIDEGRDTIWAFVLKNIYKPLFMKDAFDILVGNPPWLAYRYVERSAYKSFLKTQITKVYQLATGRAELITHLELATLFLVRTAHLYLKPDGRIAYVLPKSVFSADQHDALRRGRIRRLALSVVELWDLEKTSPLFNISAAVYFGRKGKLQTEQSVPGQVISGQLPARNASLDLAEESLRFESAQFHLSTMGRGSFWSTGDKVNLAASPYRGQFHEGASIVPRCFWFVDPIGGGLGYDEDAPALISSERARAEAKEPYKGCVIQGPLESRFIYATLLPVDLVPFGHLRLRLIVLPIAEEGGKERWYDHDMAQNAGYIHLADWLAKAQAEWEERRGTRAQAMSALERLDYQKLLTRQSLRASFRTLYATSGTHVCACVLRASDMHEPGQQIAARGVAADYTTYHLACTSEKECHFLACVLNAPCVDVAIKGAQAKGLWGARHICKKVLDLPIPSFDTLSQEHIRLAQLGQGCASRVGQWIQAGGPGKTRSIGVLRGRVRDLLSKELAEIDSIVKPMLGL